MMKKTTRLASLILALTASFATAGGENWMTDFAEAKKKAMAENKDLLVDFTGSDWCSWCIKLNDEVFHHEAFKKGVSEKFILVELDYPRDDSKLSAETKKQNTELKNTYSIQGFPTILLMDKQGRPYAQTGYQAGGPEKYLTHLDALRAKRVARDKALTTATQLTGVDKAKSLAEALKTMPDAYLSHYSEISKQITQLDPEDKSGFKTFQATKKAQAQLEKDVMTAVRSNNAGKIPAMIDQFIADHNPDPEARQELLGTKLQFMVRTALSAGKSDEAIKMVDNFIEEQKLEGEELQKVLVFKVGAYVKNKKFDQAEQVIEKILSIDPESNTARQTKSFQAHLKMMKEQAEAKDKTGNSEKE